MHPQFVDFVALARSRLGWKAEIVFATNGLLVDDALASALAPYKPKVGVSLHRPEMAGPAIEVLKKYGLLAWVGSDAATSSVDWAGQVKWHVSAPAMHCMWVTGGRVFVLADGRMSSCCFDASGDEAICNIEDFDPDKHFTNPYKLCKNCHQTLDIEGYDQRG